MAIVVVAFFFGFVVMKKATTIAIVTFFSSFIVAKKATTTVTITFWFYCNKETMVACCFRFLFLGSVAKKKKKMIISITFFNGFAAKNGDGNYHHFFRWFYGGGVVKKAMVACNHLFSFSFSLVIFWYSSLELIIHNEMVVFLMLKVVMARGRRLKKGGGDWKLTSKMLFHHNRQLGSKMLIHYNRDLGSKMLLYQN
jgi:hypothetical protein